MAMRKRPKRTMRKKFTAAEAAVERAAYGYYRSPSKEREKKLKSAAFKAIVASSSKRTVEDAEFEGAMRALEVTGRSCASRPQTVNGTFRTPRSLQAHLEEGRVEEAHLEATHVAAVSDPK